MCQKKHGIFACVSVFLCVCVLSCVCMFMFAFMSVNVFLSLNRHHHHHHHHKHNHHHHPLPHCLLICHCFYVVIFCTASCSAFCFLFKSGPPQMSRIDWRYQSGESARTRRGPPCPYCPPARLCSGRTGTAGGSLHCSHHHHHHRRPGPQLQSYSGTAPTL